jgi:hypothetical protein
MNDPEKEPRPLDGDPALFPSRPKMDKAAVFSLVLSIFGLLFFFVLFTAPCAVGVILGFVGLHRIKRARGAKRGKMLAVAGIVVGALSLAFGVLYVSANPCILHPNSPACTDKYPG